MRFAALHLKSRAEPMTISTDQTSTEPARPKSAAHLGADYLLAVAST